MNALSPIWIIAVIICYFALLMLISYFTGKDSDNEKFFLAGRQSPWYVVAFGMIGASLSGVTFISIPGVVGAGGANMDFSYMQMVLGYLLGYAVIALVLLPLYYRLNLTSIYSYLDKRFGLEAYRTGAGFFLLSRTVGASFRLYLVAVVIQEFVMSAWGVPFWVTVMVTIGLIWVYTFRGGINTIIWTDTLQTFCMLLSVVLTIIAIGNTLDLNLGELFSLVQQSEYSQVFFFSGGWSDPNNFFKQLISGALIAIVMTGLDQDMMQKNLSCRSLREAQYNVLAFSGVLVLANLLFLTLGALLYIYSSHIGLDIPAKTDLLYPEVAFNHLSAFTGIIFVLGLTAAAYSSADSALTSLTTSFCIDFLDFEKNDQSPEEQEKTRFRVHVGFSVLLFVVIVIFHLINNDAVISQIFKWAGYTYGPLLGLFSFGLFTTLKVNRRYIIPICLLAPVLSYVLDANDLFLNFKLGFLIILLNGLLTFLGLWIFSYYEEGN